MGDALINFVASAALTLFSQKAQGVKVSREILSRAFQLSKLSLLRLPRRTERGECIEALFAYAWLKNCLTAEELTALLYENLKETNKLEVAIALLVDNILSRCGLRASVEDSALKVP